MIGKLINVKEKKCPTMATLDAFYDVSERQNYMYYSGTPLIQSPRIKINEFSCNSNLDFYKRDGLTSGVS